MAVDFFSSPFSDLNDSKSLRATTSFDASPIHSK